MLVGFLHTLVVITAQKPIIDWIRIGFKKADPKNIMKLRRYREYTFNISKVKKESLGQGMEIL